MWTILILILAGVTVAVSVCKASSSSKSVPTPSKSKQLHIHAKKNDREDLRNVKTKSTNNKTTYTTKVKKEEVIKEENEEGNEVRLENEKEEKHEEMQENGKGAVKSKLTLPEEKSLNEETRSFQIIGLNCTSTFRNLTPKEQLYAHYTSQACFQGILIAFLQDSQSVAAIFIILHHIFSLESVAMLKKKAIALGFSEIEWQNFLFWSATKLTDRGSHFIPTICNVRMRTLIASSKAASIFPNLISIYESVENTIFSKLPKMAALGFPAPDVATNTVTKREYDICKAFITKKRLKRSNCRFEKRIVNGEKILLIKVASINTETIEEMFNETEIKLEKGYYSTILNLVCANLRKAGECAANDSQRQMFRKFVDHFETGGFLDYKEARKLWINEDNPKIRIQFRFKENTRNAPGNRSEFDGFVAILNHDTAKKYELLTENANIILEKLPWGEEYERKRFEKPDFAALDMIAFETFDHMHGIISGMNIKKSDSMGRNHIYSNIMNALPASMQFIKNEDKGILNEFYIRMREVKTVLHELLGHGSGKLFKRKADGNFNFDNENTVDILTGGKVTSWYEPDQSYFSVFGDLARPFEECRAYAVALVLCCDEQVLRMLGYKGTEGQSIKYCIWLKEMRDGLSALSKFQLPQKIWRDRAHDWACFVLMKVVLEAGKGCLIIEETVDSKGKDELVVHLDKSKIDSVGMPAVSEFLKKLQGYKSTADVKGATALFDRYAVGPIELKWRKICRNKPEQGLKGRIFMQPNTKRTEDGGIRLVNYEATSEGAIQSVIDRYSPESVAILENLWYAEQKKQE